MASQQALAGHLQQGLGGSIGKGTHALSPAGSQDMLLDAVERIAALERTVGQRLRDMAAGLQALEQRVAAAAAAPVTPAAVDGPASGNGGPGSRKPAPEPARDTGKDTAPEAPREAAPEPGAEPEGVGTDPVEPAAADSSNAPEGRGLFRRIFNSLNS